MVALAWDQVGERLYETGVDHGVLYVNEGGEYQDGVAWNGLTGVTESPSGAEATPLYADNIKYLNLVSVEELGGTIEAFTYPDEFGVCDGSVAPSPGVAIGQQSRKTFGFSYRTRVGNDTDATDHGYKLHIVYGALASPSEKAYATINDTPEAITFSWEFTTTPVAVTGNKPTAQLTIDSTAVDADALADLEGILYGTGGTDPRLPLPDEVIDLFEGTTTEAVATDPTFVAGTGVITIPTVTGVQYRRADTNAVVTGTVTIATPGDSLVITANPTPGYVLSETSDDDWSFTRTP
jgi:hypothetical protein